MGESEPNQGHDNQLVGLARTWNALFLQCLELTAAAHAGRPPEGVRLVGEGGPEIKHKLSEVEPLCRRSVRSLHVPSPFDPWAIEIDLDRRSRRRGVRMELVAAETAGLVNPFLRVMNPHARCGPVFGPALLIDDTCAVLPGLPTAGGASTAWLFTRNDVVRQLREVWAASAPMSRPARETRWPDVTPRQFAIARRRALGWTHAATARALGISERTVCNELSIVDRTTARIAPGPAAVKAIRR